MARRQLSFWDALVLANKPTKVVQTLQGACEQAIKVPAYQEWAVRAGQVIDYPTASEFSMRTRQDSQAKATVIKRMGL